MLTNKKGVSGVVTAFLLILLVIAAIGILWVVFQNFVKEGTKALEGSAACFETSYDVLSVTTETPHTDVVIRRVSGSDVTEIIRVSIGANDGSINTNIQVGETTTIRISDVVFTTTTVDVVIAYEFADTLCPILCSQTVTVT